MRSRRFVPYPHVRSRPTGSALRLLAPLEQAIGWDGYRLFGVDSRTLLINRLLSASDNDRVARREWLEEVYLDQRTLPYLQLSEILRARLKAVAYQPKQEQSWGYPRFHAGRYRCAPALVVLLRIAKSGGWHAARGLRSGAAVKLPCCRRIGVTRIARSNPKTSRSCRQRRH